MASLARRHPKTAMLAAAATCLICLPVLVPVLLLSSPFLFFTSLFSVGLITLFRSLMRLMHLSSAWPRRIFGSSKRRLRMQECAGGKGHGSLEAKQNMREEVHFKHIKVHEYLEDQLKNLKVEAHERSESESEEDALPCSFSFGASEGLHVSSLPGAHQG